MKKKKPLVPYYQEPNIKKKKNAHPQSLSFDPIVGIDATLDLNSLFDNFIQRYEKEVEHRVMAEVLLMSCLNGKDSEEAIPPDAVEVSYKEVGSDVN